MNAFYDQRAGEAALRWGPAVLHPVPSPNRGVMRNRASHYRESGRQQSLPLFPDSRSERSEAPPYLPTPEQQTYRTFHPDSVLRGEEVGYEHYF